MIPLAAFFFRLLPSRAGLARLSRWATCLILAGMVAQPALAQQLPTICANATCTILIDPATGNPYKAAGGGSTGNPSTVSSGQVKITTTGTAVQLPAITGVNGFVVRAKPSNTGVNGYDVAGPAGITTTCDGTGNGACEVPGSAWSFGVTSAGAVYVNGAANDVFFIYGN